MTIPRLAAAGAIGLNLPMIFAASTLPVAAVTLSVVLLAAIGAALGAVTAWATSPQPEPMPTAATPLATTGAERIAA